MSLLVELTKILKTVLGFYWNRTFSWQIFSIKTRKCDRYKFDRCSDGQSRVRSGCGPSGLWSAFFSEELFQTTELLPKRKHKFMTPHICTFKSEVKKQFYAMFFIDPVTFFSSSTCRYLKTTVHISVFHHNMIFRAHTKFVEALWPT